MIRTLEYQAEKQMVDEERFWQAVVERDGAFDGIFVLAVRSTRVYCRPSCPSRRPGRDRVLFFATPEGAEGAGFRACLRCDPKREGPSRRERLVGEACEYLERANGVPITLAALSARLKVSPFHLQRTFKRVMGVTPRQYAEALRLRQVKDGLREGQPVTRAMYDAGYGSSSRLYEAASARLGMTPGAYGRGGRGMRIAYMIADCPLGRLLVAATERGVCAVRLGDRDEKLKEALRHEYPAAEIVDWGGRDRAGLTLWMELLLRHLSGRDAVVDLPLDIRVTAFQSRVYRALRTIPRGETRSYGEVAKAIGEPRAVRAVGRACATNPAPLVIPCHRVVRANGEIGGYGLGVGRKKKLLALEAATAGDG